MNSNKLIVGLDNNDEIKEYLSKKAPGETCSFEVVGSLDEVTPDQAIFSIKETTVIKEHAEEPPTETEETAPGKSANAVLSAMGGKRGVAY